MCSFGAGAHLAFLKPAEALAQRTDRRAACRERSEMGAVTRFREMFHSLGSFGCRRGSFAAGLLAPSRLDIMAGARSCCSAMVARCGSGPAAGDAAWACSNPRPSASVRLQTVGLGATRPCMPNGRRGPQMLAAWRRPPRGAPAGPKCPGRMRSGRPFKVVDARCGRARAQWPSGEHGLRAVARAFLCV